MNLRLLILFLLFLNCISLHAQNAKKGFKKIEKQEFLEAEDIFNRVLAETPEDALAQYGLAVLYADSLFPKNDYFTAYRYLNWSRENLLKMDSSELKKIDLDISLEKITQHASYIDNMVFKQITDEKDLAKVRIYLIDFKNAGHYKDVIRIRNEMEYEKTKAMNTLEAYNEFIRKFPDADEIPDAITSRNQLAFIKAKEVNTFESINQFINDYPKAEQISLAIAIKDRMAFNKAMETNTIAALDDYIKKYPDSDFNEKAKEIRDEIAYGIALKINSVIAYNEFIETYPDAKQISAAKQKIEELLPWTCFPGIRVGMIEYNASLDELMDSFGMGNFKKDSLSFGNGSRISGTYLFPDNPEKKIFIKWKDPVKEKNPSSIYIFGDKWLTNRGIRVGMSLEKLHEINGKIFNIVGFSQDGEGTVIDWNDGELSIIHKIDEKFRLKLTYDKSKIYKVSEQGLLQLTNSSSISTDNVNLKDLDIRVEYMVILFP